MTFLFLLVCLISNSCSKDNDLFNDAVQKNIEEQILEENDNDKQIIEEENDIVIDNEISTEIKAFPSAVGAGAFASGGRGGKVLHVTTLEDGNYEGTLRWALTREFPRIVVFDISGNIKLKTGITLYKENNNLTIAGQTAPYGGITIEAPTIGFYKMNNVIVRYIRFVNTDWLINGVSHSVFTASGTNNIIVDHCSFRYSVRSSGVSFQDDNDQTDGQGQVTIQKSIVGDCYTGMLVGANAVSDQRIVLAGTNSVVKNLFVNVSHRFPNVSGNATVEVVNNVVYNYNARLTNLFNESRTNIIGNYYKKGKTSYTNYGARFKIGDYLTGISYTDPLIYIDGNIVNDDWLPLSVGDDNWKNVVLWEEPSSRNQPAPNKYRAETPFTISSDQFEILNAEDAYTLVINDVGANRFAFGDGRYGFYLDEVDKSYIDDVRNDTGLTLNKDGNYIDKTDVSSLKYPIIPVNIRSEDYDKDRDGMPDEWEIFNGFNDKFDDSKEDLDGDGYTNIEEYLNLVDATE